MRAAERTRGGARERATDVGEYLASPDTWKSKWEALIETWPPGAATRDFRRNVWLTYDECFHASQVSQGLARRHDWRFAGPFMSGL